jgi:uncharacterized protein YbjT (DUF2867 family)
MVHDPTKADTARRHGASETVPADLADPVSLKNALDGVDGVFLITPAFHPDAVQLGLNMVEAAVAAGVSKIVYNGVYHPSLSLLNHATTRPVEEALYACGLDFTVLQPAMYVQALADTYQQALSTGVVVAPWSKRSKMTYVDYRDVADSVAIAFTDQRLSRGTFELAAGGMIDRVEIAELMSLAAGKTFAAEDVPDGAPPPSGAPEALTMMFQEYDSHGFQGGNPLVLQTILQREPRSVAAFIAELAAA